MGVAKAISILVVRRLVGQDMLVRMLVEYAYGKCSISEAAHAAGVTKHVMRGILQRLNEELGGAPIAVTFLRMIGPYVMMLRVKPIIRNGMCLICSFAGDRVLMMDHIHKRHRDLVRRYVADVVELVKIKAPIQIQNRS